MSPTIEFESKNVELALQKASEELNIPADKLEHDVISHGSTGIFGLVGTKKAKIRVVLPDDVRLESGAASDGISESIQEGVASILDETFGKEGAPQDLEAAAAMGQEVLEELLGFISSEASVAVEKNGGNILYNVQGGNTAVMIGKRGQTLEALQYLVEKIVNKQLENRVRIQIDIEGYLNSRRERLESLAQRLGEKVKRSGKPATVGQFNAHDRRIIHMVLKEEAELRTHSMGEGYYRKIKIFPKKKGKKRPAK